MRLSDPLPRGVAFPLVSQLVVLVLALLILDGGFIARVVIMAMLAHWITYAMIVLRRREPFSRGDRLMMRIGFWFYLVAAFAICEARAMF